MDNTLIGLINLGEVTIAEQHARDYPGHVVATVFRRDYDEDNKVDDTSEPKMHLDCSSCEWWDEWTLPGED